MTGYAKICQVHLLSVILMFGVLCVWGRGGHEDFMRQCPRGPLIEGRFQVLSL